MQAQIVVGNGVSPQAGDALHCALDRSPGSANQVGTPGFGQTCDFICAPESSVTTVHVSGTLLLTGGSFEVLREATRSFVELRLDAHGPPLVWLDVTDIATTALPDVRWGNSEQSTSRYFGAVSKQSLATTYFPIARSGQATQARSSRCGSRTWRPCRNRRRHRCSRSACSV